MRCQFSRILWTVDRHVSITIQVNYSLFSSLFSIVLFKKKTKKRQLFFFMFYIMKKGAKQYIMK